MYQVFSGKLGYPGSLNWFLFHSGLSGISFVRIAIFQAIIYCQLTVSEFMKSFSQQKFVEESEISENAMRSFQSIFRVLCNMHTWHNQLV